MKANFTHARVPNKGNSRRDRHFVKGGNPRALQHVIPKANSADKANKAKLPKPGLLPGSLPGLPMNGQSGKKDDK
jgi:hypothetical protein